MAKWVKSTSYSYRGTEFCSQNTWQAAHSILELQVHDTQCLLFTSKGTCTFMAYTHSTAHHITHARDTHTQMYFMCRIVFSAGLCTISVLVPAESRREHQIPQTRTADSLWTAMWVLKTQSSGRAGGILKLWTISSVPLPPTYTLFDTLKLEGNVCLFQ